MTTFRFRFSGDDIAAAFGMAAPSTRCASCSHQRHEHRRVVTPNPDDRSRPHEEHFECERWDRRRKSGMCPCEGFTEPNAACPRCGGNDGVHGLVHERFGNGGGGNRRCPNANSEPHDSEEADRADG